MNPPPPNPAKPPPKGFRPNESGSNPGCCDACPYWSYPARFLSSLRIYHIEGARDSVGRRLAIDCYTYFVGFLYFLKIFPCVFVRICIGMKFTSKLYGVSGTFVHVNFATVMPDARRNKFSLSRPQSHPFLHPELDTGPSAPTQVSKHGSVATRQTEGFQGQ